MADGVFAGKQTLKQSTNKYDWLGHGVYFWENNPGRALAYAQRLMAQPIRGKASVQNPTVIGAVIDLGRCLNLLDEESISIVKDAHDRLKENADFAGINLPVNRVPKHTNELLIRDLDCLVINTAHDLRKKEGLEPFDSVRGVFVEGAPLYPGAGFHRDNHIQLCVRSDACIKGYFRVRN